jgi:hypothetical protein
MPRQNFIAKDFFLPASEKEIKEALLGIPRFASHIRFVQENKLIDSMRFCSERPGRKMHHVDVSLLPLDDQYTSVSLHASHSNGHTFYSDPELSAAIQDFEAAIHAALKGNASTYRPYEAKASAYKKAVQSAVLFVSSIGVLFLKKKLS